MNYGWQIIKILFYLGIVIGIIYLLNYFIKKGVFQQKKGQYMQVIEQLYLAPKRSLSLVRVKDRILLLSVDDKNIKLLKEWNEGDFGTIDLENDQPEFKSYLQKFMNNSWRDKNE